MPNYADRRAYAALQAYNWALVASSWQQSLKEREAARALSNSEPAALTQWQQWLLDHVDTRGLDGQQARELAEMWVQVAAAQPPSSPDLAKE